MQTRLSWPQVILIMPASVERGDVDLVVTMIGGKFVIFCIKLTIAKLTSDTMV